MRWEIAMCIQAKSGPAWAFLFTIILFSVSSHGQVVFERTYGGAEYDVGWSVQQTQDGGYVIAGGTGSFGSGGTDFYLVKTDSLGDTLWTRTYGDTADDWSYSVQETSDGGYVLTGYTGLSGPTPSDLYLIKTDPLGDTVWTKIYGGTDYESGYSVRETSDGGYVVSGYTGSFGVQGEDIYLLKTDSLGDTVWTRTYGGPFYENGPSVEVTQDGGYIVAGWTNSIGAGRDDVYIIKTDSMGDSLWTRTYGDTAGDWANCVQQTQDGGYILTGVTANLGFGTGDLYIVKTDSLGSAVWTKTYGDTALDIGHSVRETQDGGYIVAGYTTSFGSGAEDVYLIRTDPLGDTLWTRTYGGTSRDKGHSVEQTQDGGFIIGGEMSSFATADDFYLLKTNADGLLGIHEERWVTEIQRPNGLYLRNMPNPFERETVILYSVPVTGHVSLQVFDITGRIIDTVVEQVQGAGTYAVRWNGEDRAVSICFCRLHAAGLRATTKMILLR
jgi:hypothetical protein